MLYKDRKTLLTRVELLTPNQAKRLDRLWATDERHVALEVTWRVYQDLIAAYNQPTRQQGKTMMNKVLHTLRSRVPAGLEELAQLGRSLWRKRRDILTFFDVGASNGPVEAVNGRLEHLRGIALGFRNLGNYVRRCLIHSGKLQLGGSV